MKRILAFCLCVLFIGLTALAKDETTPVKPESLAASVEKAAEPDLVLSVHRPHASTTQPSTTVLSTNWTDLVRVPLALVVVVLLMVGIRWLMRRSGVGRATQAGAAAVTVLSRTALPPKQQVLLLKVGRRVLVTWSNGSEMGLLSEVVDPEEVSELVGRIQQQKADSITQSFASLFTRAEKGFHEVPEDELAQGGDGESTAGAGDDKLASDVSGLRQQIQSLRQRFNGDK